MPQQGNNHGQPDNPFVKAVVGWLFPSSIFEPDHQDKCDQGSVDTERTAVESDDDDWDDDWDDTYSIESDDGEDSSVSEATRETQSRLSFSLEKNDDDWDDTCGIKSNDEDPSVSGANADFRSCLSFSLDEYNDDDEGHFYFNPTLQDFPQVREAATCAQEEEEKRRRKK